MAKPATTKKNRPQSKSDFLNPIFDAVGGELPSQRRHPSRRERLGPITISGPAELAPERGGGGIRKRGEC